MPGIVGLVTKLGRGHAERQLEQMCEVLRHESFYETGTWVDESLGIYVGWVNRKGSGPSNPLVSDRGDLILLFSGEDFSREAAEHAGSSNGHIRSEPQGKYIVDLAEKNANFPAVLNGRFQGLLVRRNHANALLFNDRYGLARIYYHEGKDGLYFAAEAKAILAVQPALRAIDPHGLGELVSCGCVLENRSVFKNIGVLPPASAWTLRNGAVEKKETYFDPREWEEQEPLDVETYYEQLRERFSQVVPMHLGGYRSIGMSLTGGLDSRMIMAWSKAAPQTMTCFSFGGPFRDCEDVTIARKVAAICGQKHETIRVGEEFLNGFPHYSARSVFLTDGCVDVSRAPDLYINVIAREIAPARMTGNYGGEVLRSIRAFKPVEPPVGLFQPEFSSYVGQARTTYQSLIQVRPLSFSVFRQAPWHHYGLLSLEQTQLALRTPYLDNELVRIVFRAPKSTLSSNDISLRLIQDGNPALRELRTDRGLAGDSNQLYSKLRREFLEFTFKAEYAYDYGMPQWVARADHGLSRLRLERIFLGRHKFYHFRVWYRDALANYVREMLLDPRTLSRPYLQRKTVEEIVAGHLKGHRNYTTAIHKILTLEHLHRSLIDA
jgi:asparagine synthase (glutamine-hydrolysing)